MALFLVKQARFLQLSDYKVMMKWIVGWVALFAFGCAAAPLAPEKKERVYPADYDRTWNAVLDVLNERVLPLRIVQKDSGIVVTDFVERRTGAIKRFKLNISVRPQSSSTKVRIDGRFEYFQRGGSFDVGRWEVEESTGEVEADLFQSIEKKLAAALVKE